jgi:hypothetical protein
VMLWCCAGIALAAALLALAFLPRQAGAPEPIPAGQPAAEARPAGAAATPRDPARAE